MGDVLAGIHSTWEFGADSVLIRCERGIRASKLLQVLGERRVPYQALRAAELVQGGKRGTVVLRAVPRPGADPLMDAADGQLRAGDDPYRLVLPADRRHIAARCVERLTQTLGPDAAEPAPRPLVPAPAAPLRFKAYDGKASFDGATVCFRWSWTGASSAKWKAGDQSFPVSTLSGVEWRSPEPSDRQQAKGSFAGHAHGHLRLLRQGEPEACAADQNPAAVIFGLGYGLVHESLPLAAAVLQAVRGAHPTTAPTHEHLPAGSVPQQRAGRADPSDIADRIRCLGDLHTAGLLTDEEFTAKKAELLAEL